MSPLPSTVRSRALLCLLLASAAVAAGILVSPAGTVAFFESVVADPVLFGALVVGLYLFRPLVAWPTTPLAVVVGYGYGVAVGVPVALLGVVATVTPVYLVAGWAVAGDGSVTADGRVGDLLASAETGVTRYYETAGPIRGVIASRLAPIPSDVATVAAAVSGVGLWRLLVGTAIGELPWTVAAVVVGASAATATAGGLGELGVALTVACLVGASLLLAGPLYRSRLAGDRSSSESAGPTDG